MVVLCPLKKGHDSAAVEVAVEGRTETRKPCEVTGVIGPAGACKTNSRMFPVCVCVTVP